jgi:hypothetical protein
MYEKRDTKGEGTMITDDAEKEAKRVHVQAKHVIHEEALKKVITDLEYNLEHHSTFTDMESIFVHVRANAAALLFLCQERKRDRAKRGDNYTKPGTPLAPPGSDLEK